MYQSLISPKGNFFLIAGPCVVENREVTFTVAREVAAVCRDLQIPFFFKASYRKANRSSLHSFTGIGDDAALQILAEVKEQLGLPIVTDIHTEEEAAKAAEVADIIQIPAFLCRQTDLLLACADTGRVINVKKGQFLAPGAMEQVIKKIESRGNHQILLTERGSSFGYGDLVVDMRSLVIMKQFGYPVIFDATHSVQKPGALGSATGGNRQLAPVLAKAAVALGIAGVFFEAHPTPDTALSDGPNSLDYPLTTKMVKELCALDTVVKKFK